MHEWTSYEIASFKVSKEMLWVGIIGVVIAVGTIFITLMEMRKDTDKKVKAQQEATDKKVEAQRENTEMLADKLDNAMLAFSDKTRVPDMLGKTKKEAFAKSEEVGLDISRVKVESLPLSEVSQILESKGLTYISSSDTTVDFLNPITKDTIVIKVGTIFDQEPKGDAIAKLGSKIRRLSMVTN